MGLVSKGTGRIFLEFGLAPLSLGGGRFLSILVLRTLMVEGGVILLCQCITHLEVKSGATSPCWNQLFLAGVVSTPSLPIPSLPAVSSYVPTLL